MCSNVEDLRKELYVDDLLPALSSVPVSVGWPWWYGCGPCTIERIVSLGDQR
jgi:hypothetical protein